MERQEIFQRLTTIFRQVLGHDEIVLTPETTADDVEDWDSFNHVNLVVAVEMEFGIKFTSPELDDLKNVGDFVALIEKRTSANS